MIKKWKTFINHYKVRPAQKIFYSFLGVIFIGTILLMLPVSNKGNINISFIDALFTSTSATCVTGLVVHVTSEQFTFFGHLVLLLLIQIGGLGLMTILAIITIYAKQKLSLDEKVTVKEMLNQDSLSDMKSFIVHIFKYTMVFEGIGAILLCFILIPEYGFWNGLFKSIFTSVSAFCNAGFDIFGDSSLISYYNHEFMNLIIMSLIILGGLGFIVWYDIFNGFKKCIHKKQSWNKLWKNFSVHTKIVCSVTIFLILSGTILFFLLEYSNPETIGSYTLWDKIQVSLFQSVTLRTAGFVSVNYVGLHDASKFFMAILMFIGGSPGGTAGGIKTVTFVLIIMFIYSQLRGEKETVMFKRTIHKEKIYQALLILAINLSVLFLGLFMLLVTQNFDFVDVMFEAVSAMATVGVSVGITSMLNIYGKIMIILLMFIGRIGIFTFLLAFMKKKHSRTIHYPDANVLVG